MILTHQLIGCRNGVALKMTTSKPPVEPLLVEMLADRTMTREETGILYD